MSIPRVFSPIILAVAARVVLDYSIGNHLVNVLRLTQGDEFILFNGKGNEYRARICEIFKHQVTAQVSELILRDNESPLKIHLGQGIARGEKMDFILQKTTELGVNSITPLVTEHGNVKIVAERLNNKLQHWRGVVTHATEQSGRCFIPEINAPVTFAAWIQMAVGLKLILDPTSSQRLVDLTIKPPVVSLLIGPEGGFSDQEITQAKAQGFLPLRLGPRILRTESAALAAISVMQNLWGDF